MTSPRVVQIGNFRYPWCSEVHFKAGLEANGCVVLAVQENTLRWADLPRIVERHNGQMVMWTRTWEVDTKAALTALASLRAAGVPSVSYHLDRWWGLEREYHLDSEPFFHTDLVVTPDGSPVDWAGRGINHLWMPPGVHAAECRIGRVRRDRYPWDVVFVGSNPYPHPSWRPVRAALIDAFTAKFGDRFKVLPGGGPAIRGQELADLYRTVPVILGDSCLVGNPTGYWSDRVPETLGRGGALIHPKVQGMADWYCGGADLLIYEPDRPEQAVILADALLRHEDDRKAIATHGQATVLGRDTYAHRMATLIEHVGSTFGFPEVALPPIRARWKPNPRITASFTVNSAAGVAEGVREVWETNDYRITAEMVRNGTVVDVGANAGAFSVLVSKLGAKRVIAYEPHPKNLALLRANVKANAVRNVEIIDRPVLGHARPVVLAGEGGGVFLTDRAGTDDCLDLAVVTINEVIDTAGDVALLKIDVEGSEYDIIAGLDEERLRRVRRIVMEFHGPEMPHLCWLEQDGAHLERWGAMVAKLADSGRVETMGHPNRGGWIFWTRY